jgi:hypothetical protein
MNNKRKMKKEKKNKEREKVKKKKLLQNKLIHRNLGSIYCKEVQISDAFLHLLH